MDISILSEKSVTPDEKVISSIIGDKILLWKKILEYLHENHLNISEKWKFAQDVKFWFYRALKKKKTIFYIRVLEDTFRIAFWFNDRADSFIEQSGLSDLIKNDFKKEKKIGNMGRCISIDMADTNDLNTVYKLIELKLKIK